MASISPTIQVNILNKHGTVEEISLGTACSHNEVTSYTALFQEYRDIFAWSYLEMPYISPVIVEQYIDTWLDTQPIKQKHHQLHLFKEEVNKQ